MKETGWKLRLNRRKLNPIPTKKPEVSLAHL